MKKVAIIGGGASGLLAACKIDTDKNKVVLFEKQKKIGRKLLITGNGRCNISNRFVGVDGYNGTNPKFVNNVLSRFGINETMEFFQSIGLPVCEGKDGKMYPGSLQASTVCMLFEHELKQRGVDVHLHRRIDGIKKTSKGFSLVTAGQEHYLFDSVILAAGSCAFPKVGGSMSGYKLAESLGHSVCTLFPAILPIDIPLKALHRLQGVKWDCALHVMHKGKELSMSQGELLFTAYGISGPAALDISRTVNKLVIEGGAPEIVIDFFPEMEIEELKNILNKLWFKGAKPISFSLFGIINNRVPEILLSILLIDPHKMVTQLSKNEKEKIIQGLKAFTIFPGRPRSFEEAVIAAGGVAVNEIDPSTMQSKIVKGLYITGELLDIDGISGGYNLQFAWSTGAIAGMSQ